MMFDFVILKENHGHGRVDVGLQLRNWLCGRERDSMSLWLLKLQKATSLNIKIFFAGLV